MFIIKRLLSTDSELSWAIPSGFAGKESTREKKDSSIGGPRERHGQGSDFVIYAMLRLASRISQKSPLPGGVQVKAFMLVLPSFSSITLLHSIPGPITNTSPSGWNCLWVDLTSLMYVTAL